MLDVERLATWLIPGFVSDIYSRFTKSRKRKTLSISRLDFLAYIVYDVFISLFERIR